MSVGPEPLSASQDPTTNNGECFFLTRFFGGVWVFFHRGYEKPTLPKHVLCYYFSFWSPWWKKLYSDLGHHDFLSRIPFQPSGKALGLKSYPQEKITASAVRNYYLGVWDTFFFALFLARECCDMVEIVVKGILLAELAVNSMSSD